VPVFGALWEKVAEEVDFGPYGLRLLCSSESRASFESSFNSIEYQLNQMGFKWAVESGQTGIECPLNHMAFKLIEED